MEPKGLLQCPQEYRQLTLSWPTRIRSTPWHYFTKKLTLLRNKRISCMNMKLGPGSCPLLSFDSSCNEPSGVITLS